MEELHTLVSTIAKGLVDNPEEVVVRPVEGEQLLVIELQVAKSDVGKIIGKHGNNIRSLRTILGAVSTKLKKRTVLDLVE